VRRRIVIGVIAGGLLMSAIIAATPSTSKRPERPRWEYTVIRHSPLLKSGGTDLKNIQEIGKEGWELAASYPTRGEVIYSIFKRPK